MELGNMVFGNARGNFSLPRNAGFEEELYRLFEAYSPDRDNSWREYGEDFENDTFMIFPYYWGDCNCGYEEIDKFNEGHSLNCYQTELTKMMPNDIIIGEKANKVYRKLTKKFNLPMQGCAVHCTCDYEDRYAIYLKSIGYPEGHLEKCLLRKPNFLYKPMGFEIQWYKYPLRDSYSNIKITLAGFRNIIDDCIKSLS